MKIIHYAVVDKAVSNVRGELYSCFIQCSSVAQSCQTLCDPMDCSMPGFTVHHQLPELAQTHVHRAGDAIQPSHPLSSPSPPAVFAVVMYRCDSWTIKNAEC